VTLIGRGIMRCALEITAGFALNVAVRVTRTKNLASAISIETGTNL